MRSTRLDRSSPSAGATYLDRDATVAELRRLARGAARQDRALLRVVLFGSLVRGTATPCSDADLVAITRGGAPRRMDRVPHLLKLFERSPLPLDIHPFTEAEWERARAREDPLARLVEREGIDLLRA